MLYSSLFYLQECVCNEKCPLEFPSKNSLAVDVSCSLGDPQTRHMGFSLPWEKNTPVNVNFLLKFLGVLGSVVILCGLESCSALCPLEEGVVIHSDSQGEMVLCDL